MSKKDRIKKLEKKLKDLTHFAEYLARHINDWKDNPIL